MLCEVFRILKSGGVLRIATPDFRFLFELYLHREDPKTKRYLAWSASAFYSDVYDYFKENVSFSSPFIISYFFVTGDIRLFLIRKHFLICFASLAFLMLRVVLLVKVHTLNYVDLNHMVNPFLCGQIRWKLWFWKHIRMNKERFYGSY